MNHGQIHIWLNSWDVPFVFDKDEWRIIPGVGVVYYVEGDKNHIRVVPFHKIEGFDVLYE